jgi:hypothetical protein
MVMDRLRLPDDGQGGVRPVPYCARYATGKGTCLWMGGSCGMGGCEEMRATSERRGRWLRSPGLAALA